MICASFSLVMLETQPQFFNWNLNKVMNSPQLVHHLNPFFDLPPSTAFVLILQSSQDSPAYARNKAIMIGGIIKTMPMIKCMVLLILKGSKILHYSSNFFAIWHSTISLSLSLPICNNAVWLQYHWIYASIIAFMKTIARKQTKLSFSTT